jgi:ABC-type glutathione transport system ATPase component
MEYSVSAPFIKVSNLTKQYGDLVVVSDVSFDLPQSGSIGIVGESGSGKTTIAKVLVGLERATSGKIEVDGHDWSLPAKNSKERRERAKYLQIVFQDPYSSLDPRQTIGSALREALTVSGKASDEAEALARELAELVGLPNRILDFRPAKLSGGQRQRVAIARSLAAEPKGLILDESVAALDVSIQAQILNLLADIRELTGIAYLLVSHDLAVVRHFADSLIVMKDGQVVERGFTEQVMDSPQHEYTKLLLASVPGPGWVPGRRTL